MTLGLLAVTVSASLVVAPGQPRPPAIPTTATEPYEARLGTFRSLGVTETKYLVETMRAAEAWVRRSSRYVSIFCRNNEVKVARATISVDVHGSRYG